MDGQPDIISKLWNERLDAPIQEHRRVFLYGYILLHQEGRELSRGHTCCQLFVTDKGFVYVVPMKSKGEVLQVVKQFTKEIGVPDAISL